MAHPGKSPLLTYSKRPIAVGYPEQERVVTINCLSCEDADTIRLSKSLPESVIFNKFRQDDWVINSRNTSATCPTCATSGKRKAMTTNPQTHKPRIVNPADLDRLMQTRSPAPNLPVHQVPVEQPPISDQPPTPLGYFTVPEDYSRDSTSDSRANIMSIKVPVVWRVSAKVLMPGAVIGVVDVQSIAFRRLQSLSDIAGLRASCDELLLEDCAWTIDKVRLDFSQLASPKRIVVFLKPVNPAHIFNPPLPEREGWHTVGEPAVRVPIQSEDTSVPKIVKGDAAAVRFKQFATWLRSQFHGYVFTAQELANGLGTIVGRADMPYNTRIKYAKDLLKQAVEGDLVEMQRIGGKISYRTRLAPDPVTSRFD